MSVDTIRSLPAFRPRLPPPPRGLSAESRRFWRAIVAEYEVGPHHLALLRIACASLDRLRQCEEAIAAEGVTITGRFGRRAHPLLATEAAARIGFMRAVREMGIDLADPAISKPPSRWRA